VLTKWGGTVRQGSKRTLTTFDFVGTKTVTLVLGWGSYTYACSRHSRRGMYESFYVD
jgi:plastocyanin